MRFALLEWGDDATRSGVVEVSLCADDSAYQHDLCYLVYEPSLFFRRVTGTGLIDQN